MNARSTLLVAPALAASLVTGDSLEWSPPTEQALHRELLTRHLLVTESMVFRKGEVETISQQVFELQIDQTLRTTDRILEVGEGRPRKLRRSYDEVKLSMLAEMSGGPELTREDVLEARGAVEGHSVLFTWVPEDREYGRCYDRLEGIEEVLPLLAEDLGMRSLLPGEPVDLGSTWKLPPGFLVDVIGAGGNLDFDFSQARDPNAARTIRLGTGGYLCDVFGAEEQGEVTAEWVEVEELDGRRLARIALEFDVTVSNDLTALANRTRTIEEVRARLRVQSAKVTLHLVGTGLIRWDLDAGRLHDTQDLSADERIHTVLAFDAVDASLREEQELVMVGKLVQETRITVDETGEKDER